MEEKHEENLFSKEEWDSLIHWQPVAIDFEEQEKKESEALEKPDFYNRILLIRSGR